MGRNLGPLNIKDTYEGLVQITSGSILTDGSGSDITSVNITASNALQAGTSGYSVSASFSDQAGTAGYASAAGFADQSGTAGFATIATSASWSDQAGTSGYATTALSSSYAVTASFALNVPATASHALFAESSSKALVSTSGNNITYQVVFAPSGSGYKTLLQDSTSTQFRYNPSTNDLSFGASIAGAYYTNAAKTRGLGASNLLLVDNGFAYIALEGTPYIYLRNGDVEITQDLVANDITASAITATNATFQSASITNLTTVTGSIVQIGDAFVLLNTGDAARYAGILVEDSGSAPVNYTASFFFDSQLNDWNYEYTSGSTDYGVALFGPTYSTKGVPTYLTTNTLPKAEGNHHLIDSSISDDGTDVVVSANISASGFVSASSYYGDGSNLSGITGFPYTGSAEITGSLKVIGKIQTGDSNNNARSEYGAVIGGTNSQTNASAQIQGIFVARDANISSTGEYNVVVGSEGNSITNGGWNTAIGGYFLSVQAGNNNIVAGGESNTINGGSNAGMFAGISNTLSHDRSAVIGGTGLSTSKTDEVVVPNLTATTVTSSIQATDLDVVNAAVFQSGLTITGSAVITGSLGSGTLIDNVGTPTASAAIEHIVYISQSEYNALTPDSNTMYVITGTADTILTDTLVSGSLRGEVNSLTIASTTASMDCSLGNYFTLGLANGVDTRLEASNIATGQTINIKITNNATAAGTISFGPEFEFEGGTPFTATAATNAVDIITLVSFDGTSLQTVGVKNFS